MIFILPDEHGLSGAMHTDNSYIFCYYFVRCTVHFEPCDDSYFKAASSRVYANMPRGP